MVESDFFEKKTSYELRFIDLYPTKTKKGVNMRKFLRLYK